MPPGGHYSLTIPNNVYVYSDNATGTFKGTSRITSGQQLADADQVLWVEGRGMAQGSGTLTLTWTRTWTDFQGTVRTETVNDSVKITTVEFAGPRDVPGTSIYTYAATGGVPGAGSTWVGGGVGGTMKTPNQENPTTNTDTAQFNWNPGPIIGHAAYQAGPGYIWDMEANVVRVDINPPAAPKKEFDVDPDVPRDGDVGLNAQDELAKQVNGDRINNDGGIQWAATFVLTGPLGGRGINKIQTGFIQTLQTVVDRGFYSDGAIRISSLESIGPMNDSSLGPPAAYPWTHTNVFSVRTGVRSNDKDTYKWELNDSDGPKPTVPVFDANGGVLTDVRIDLAFQLDISSATLDPTVANEKIYRV